MEMGKNVYFETDFVNSADYNRIPISKIQFFLLFHVIKILGYIGKNGFETEIYMSVLKAHLGLSFNCISNRIYVFRGIYECFTTPL